MNEDFELISVPKELLEDLVRRILAEYIRATDPNASEKQDQPDTLEKIELPSSMVYPEAKVQQVAAVLPNGVRVTNVHDAYIAGMFEGSGLAKLKAEQDEEPVAYIQRDQLEKAMRAPMLCAVSPEPRQDRVGIYLHPAPQKSFVRLSEEEVDEIVALAQSTYEAACATENRLVRKNQ